MSRGETGDTLVGKLGFVGLIGIGDDWRGILDA